MLEEEKGRPLGCHREECGKNSNRMLFRVICITRRNFYSPLLFCEQCWVDKLHWKIMMKFVKICFKILKKISLRKNFFMKKHLIPHNLFTYPTLPNNLSTREIKCNTRTLTTNAHKHFTFFQLNSDKSGFSHLLLETSQ
jgi:hypothetical protein